ncbi:MAG: stage III sporulation protein AG [Oscillospiraceae bacterium]|nr:stage III sporulation protein AG [Oscillospiraceae bacterium]
MKKTVIQVLKKYKFVALILLVGLVLMLLPTSGGNAEGEPEERGDAYSLSQTEQRLESLLRNVQGVGQVKVMLTLKSGSTLELAKDSSTSVRDNETKRDSDVVTVSRGGGSEEVVITQERYPVYQGAVVVCEGGGNSAVRLAVIETVSVLTGLGSDKITVVQWK